MTEVWTSFAGVCIVLERRNTFVDWLKVLRGVPLPTEDDFLKRFSVTKEIKPNQRSLDWEELYEKARTFIDSGGARRSESYCMEIKI